MLSRLTFSSDRWTKHCLTCSPNFIESRAPSSYTLHGLRRPTVPFYLTNRYHFTWFIARPTSTYKLHETQTVSGQVTKDIIWRAISSTGSGLWKFAASIIIHFIQYQQWQRNYIYTQIQHIMEHQMQKTASVQTVNYRIPPRQLKQLIQTCHIWRLRECTAVCIAKRKKHREHDAWHPLWRYATADLAQIADNVRICS